ncbi:hypothetical protein HYX70_03170 [Candidatus Saccharibacteria bacterium]|nr:hypothetical protein [Candidatus Saccharibacteria bacterium]
MKKEITEFLDPNIKYRWLDHPAVFTVAESMRHIKDKTPVKNLLLKEKGSDRKLLVIMSGEQRLDMKALAAEIDTKNCTLQTSPPYRRRLV